MAGMSSFTPCAPQRSDNVKMPFISWGTKIYYSQAAGALLRNSVFCLARELKGCDTVLDLGCGHNSFLQYTPPKFSVGVEYFMPYLLESRRKGIHNLYVRADIRDVEFAPGSFDAVLLLNVIEHMDRQSVFSLLSKAAVIARKKIIVISPNGFLNQGSADGNELQAHKSGWRPSELISQGFKAYGVNGLISFRKDSHRADQQDYDNSLLSTIRFKPRLFWLIAAELSQVIAYYFPGFAFEVFYAKKVGG